jgi:hypothetical protein
MGDSRALGTILETAAAVTMATKRWETAEHWAQSLKLLLLLTMTV